MVSRHKADVVLCCSSQVVGEHTIVPRLHIDIARIAINNCESSEPAIRVAGVASMRAANSNVTPRRVSNGLKAAINPHLNLCSALRVLRAVSSVTRDSANSSNRCCVSRCRHDLGEGSGCGARLDQVGTAALMGKSDSHRVNEWVARVGGVSICVNRSQLV